MNRQKVKVVFLGSPAEVLGPLKALLDNKNLVELVSVVSQPSRPVGRGKTMTDPPVAAFAKSQHLNCLQPESAKDPQFLDELRRLQPDIMVTAAYGQILTDDLLKIPKRATINIHPSRLPLLRGATPVPGALLAGMTETGVTILFTVRKLDAGPIIAQKVFQIKPDETAGELTLRLFDESAPMLQEAIELLATNLNFAGTPQDETRVTFCKKIEKDQGCVDWTLDAEEVVHRYRAFEPWPGSWTTHLERRINLQHISLAPAKITFKGPPGIFEFDRNEKIMIVCCGKGHIQIRTFKPAGSKGMDAGSFWNGIKDKHACLFKKGAINEKN